MSKYFVTENLHMQRKHEILLHVLKELGLWKRTKSRVIQLYIVVIIFYNLIKDLILAKK